MTQNNYIGNITTIIKYICMLISGWVIGIAVAHGLNLPLTEAQLSEIIFIIVMFIISYLDSSFSDTFSFHGNKPVNSNGLNQEYIIKDENNDDRT